jgi:hypothetical protein
MDSSYISSNENIIENIAKLQEEYYSKNNKKFFFKQNQKKECANKIIDNIDIQILFNKTIFIIPEKKIIYFDYTIFKTFITTDIFDSFLEYEYNLTNEWIKTIDSYQMHINIQSLSISAIERYRTIIDKILQRYPPNFPNSLKMDKIFVYYTPNMMEQMLNFISPFISHLREKMIFYSKVDSPKYLSDLFTM